jgi:hypothetical protein
MILDNLDEIYQEVLEELSYRVGIVNLKDAYHFALFVELVEQSELGEYTDLVIESLCEADDAGKIMVKNIKSGNLYPIDKAGFKNKIHQKASSADIEKAKQKEDEPVKVEKPKKQPKVEPKSKVDTEVKSFDEKTIKKKETKLLELAEKIKNVDKPTKERNLLFIKNWNKFMNAKTEKERVEAVREMAEYKLIEGHSDGKKIYLTDVIKLGRKALTSEIGDDITREMNIIISKYGIDVPKSGGSSDLSGKHNEAGVVADLDPSKENVSARDEFAKRFEAAGGNVAKSDMDNKKAANTVREDIEKEFPGAKITKAIQVGGDGKNKLGALGIDNKTDPTDVLVEITLPNGNKKFLKYSLKVYDDPKNITMKNSGVNNAGAVYLGGDFGKKIDDFKSELDKKYHWNDDMGEAEQKNNKVAYRQEYLKEFSEQMNELAQTKDGQAQLLKMWKEIHGCGKDVRTLITNKRTGNSVIHSADYYCNPKLPFKVQYDGVKIVVNMGGTDDSTYVQLDLKTEKNNSKKLLFRHRIK